MNYKLLTYIIKSLFLFSTLSYANNDWTTIKAFNLLGKIKSINSDITQINSDGSVYNGTLSVSKPNSVYISYKDNPIVIETKYSQVLIKDTLSGESQSYAIDKIALFKLLSSNTSYKDFNILSLNSSPQDGNSIKIATEHLFSGELIIYFKNNKIYK